TPKEFRNQLQLFKNEGDILDAGQISQNVQDILSSKENFFLLTFDDGLIEQLNFALPIIDELNMSAIFFPNSLNFQEKKVSSVHKIHLLRSILEPKNFLKILLRDEKSMADVEKKNAHNHYRYDDKSSAEIKFFLNFKMSTENKNKTIDNLFASYF